MRDACSKAIGNCLDQSTGSRFAFKQIISRKIHRQAQWKRRLDAFTAFTAGSAGSRAGLGAATQGHGNSGGRTRLRKIRKGSSSCRSPSRLENLAAKRRRSAGGSKSRKTGINKAAKAADIGGGWRCARCGRWCRVRHAWLAVMVWWYCHDGCR